MVIDDFNDFYDPLIKRANVAAHLHHPAYRLIEADICHNDRMNEIFAAENFDAIVHLAARAGRTGVWRRPDDEPADLAGDIARLPLVAVQFPQFTDGRGYSTARLLRERYGFAGELRAIGEVLRDQLFYLERVGFNAFDLKEGKSLEDALLAFGDFSDAYQSSVERPLPHYRRRPAGADA